MSRRSRRGKGKKNKGRRRHDEGGKDSQFAKKVVFFVVVLTIVIVGVVTVAYALRQQGRDSVVDPGTGGNDEEDPSEQVFDFSVTDIDGNEFKLSAQTEKMVLVDLMATWCGPCTQQLTEIKYVIDSIGSENIQVISLDIDTEREDDELLRTYREEHGVTWTMAMDTPGLGTKYQVQSIPTMILYDTHGNILKMWEGMRTSDEIIEECEKHL